MSSPFEIIKLVPYLEHWSTRLGYFVVLVLLLVTGVHVAGVPSITRPSSLIFPIASIALWTPVWFVASRRLVIPSASKSTVVFCFEIDTEGRRNYARIVSKINSELTNIGLSKH